jgi:hypothetical protein
LDKAFSDREARLSKHQRRTIMPLGPTPHAAIAYIPITTSEKPWSLRVQVMLMLLSGLLFTVTVQGQRCLDLSILGLMGQHLHVPDDPEANFGYCQTKLNGNKQVEITSYGQDLADMDSMVTRTGRKFNDAVLQANMTGMPTDRSVENSQELARKLQGMTPEQQQAWAMKYAAQQMQNAQARPVSEDPKMGKLLGDVHELFIQINQLNSAFSAKFRTLNEAQAAELDKVTDPDGHECPEVDKLGAPSCACINGLWGKHFQRKLDIEKEYDARKIELLNQLITRNKAMVGQAEADISALRYGDALNNPSFKKQLLSYQAAIFSAAFAVTGSTIEHIRTESSDIYVNKVNCDKLKYNQWCD